MTEEIADEVAEIGVRRIDDADVTFFAAGSACEEALRACCTGNARNRSEAYWSYGGVLDREQAAPRNLQAPDQ